MQGQLSDEIEGEAQVESRLLILYLIDKMDMPMSNSQISQFAIEEDYASYFGLQQSLEEMTSTGLLEKFQSDNTTRYAILEKGYEVLELFNEEISEDVREKVSKYVAENKKSIQRDFEVVANYFYDYTRNEYIVKCGVYEEDIMLMELNISVVSKPQAQTICENWKENINYIYPSVIEMITAEKRRADE
jgi:DNA-binding PadR family transcriptional regulator